MNRFFRLLGDKTGKYSNAELSVRIEPVFREEVRVIYERGQTCLSLNGEYIGNKWQGIQVHIPQELEVAKAVQIAEDLEIAFKSMEYGYQIVRIAGTEIVSESEQQAALAELHDMGYEIEISPDRKQIHQKKLAGAPRKDVETLRRETPQFTASISRVFRDLIKLLVILGRKTESVDGTCRRRSL